jgi:hypothetical protein
VDGAGAIRRPAMAPTADEAAQAKDDLAPRRHGRPSERECRGLRHSLGAQMPAAAEAVAMTQEEVAALS